MSGHVTSEYPFKLSRRVTNTRIDSGVCAIANRFVAPGTATSERWLRIDSPRRKPAVSSGGVSATLGTRSEGIRAAGYRAHTARPRALRDSQTATALVRRLAETMGRTGRHPLCAAFPPGGTT